MASLERSNSMLSKSTIMRCRRAIAVGVAAAVIAGSSGIVRATNVVLDPTNLAENVEQVAQEVQLLAQMEQQVQNQLRMLQGWQFTRLDRIVAQLAALDNIFRASGPTYEDADAAPALNEQYPTAYGDDAPQRMASLQPRWEQRRRDALVENRQVQNQVARDIEPTRQRVAEYVERSNAAPGVTAAIQAGNELTATLAGQIQAIEALEVTAARTDAEEEAREQSEEAYGRERQAWVMRDWDSAPSPAPVSNPFGN
jgi:P-type conjugative transfer protein TrbJ